MTRQAIASFVHRLCCELEQALRRRRVVLLRSRLNKVLHGRGHCRQRALRRTGSLHPRRAIVPLLAASLRDLCLLLL